MGFFRANAPAALHPISPPLGVHQNFVAQQPTTLCLKEKVFSFSGDDFSVKDQNGMTVVKCMGKTFSLRDRKVITDANGVVLYRIRNKLLSLMHTFVAEDDNGNEIFRSRQKWSFASKLNATFNNFSTGQATTILLRGDFWGGSADLVVEGGPVVAQISRQLLNARQIFADQQTYFVTCAPGVDLSLMAAICICFDEAKNEHNDLIG